ncbi:hypothetical protein D9M70_483750 [compost metagenome]
MYESPVYFAVLPKPPRYGVVIFIEDFKVLLDRVCVWDADIPFEYAVLLPTLEIVLDMCVLFSAVCSAVGELLSVQLAV